jgi:four helix bundle protein
MGRDYRKLLAWKKADELVMSIYEKSRCFPREEIYGLTSQLRRAALSVPTNIAEGMVRKTNKDKSHFLNQAEASLSEAGYLLDVARRLDYLAKENFVQLAALQEETARILCGLARTVSNSDPA